MTDHELLVQQFEAASAEYANALDAEMQYEDRKPIEKALTLLRLLMTDDEKNYVDGNITFEQLKGAA